MSDEPIAALPITLEAPALAGEVTPPAKPKRPKSKRLKDTALWAAMTPELWDLSRVLPSALNARIHTAKQVKAIAESMKQFGFTIPILGAVGFDAEFMGFDLDKLAITLDPAKGEDPNDGDGVNGDHKSGGERGELLSLINIAVADPRHECKLGDHYELRAGDEVHDLLVFGVIGTGNTGCRT